HRRDLRLPPGKAEDIRGARFDSNPPCQRWTATPVETCSSTNRTTTQVFAAHSVRRTPRAPSRDSDLVVCSSPALRVSHSHSAAVLASGRDGRAPRASAPTVSQARFRAPRQTTDFRADETHTPNLATRQPRRLK